MQRPKQSGTLQHPDATGIPSLGRVGVEVSETSSLLSWDTTAAAAATTREGTIVRPYYAAGDPPLSRERTTAEYHQSAANKVCVPSSTTLIPRSAESRERCTSTRASSRNHQVYIKGHDMEQESKDDNEPHSGTSSPEVTVRLFSIKEKIQLKITKK